MKHRAFLHLSTAIGAMLACHPGAAAAQSASAAQATATSDGDQGSGIADIVVTAQRRSESLQKVPIAVAAIDGTALQASGVQGTDSLKVAVPSLDIPKNTGSASPFIRGIGSRAIGPGVENPVAVYVDGVYMAAPTSGLLAITQAMPLGFLLSLLFLVLTMIFVATTSDSMSYVIATSMSNDNPSAALRAFWGIAMGVMALILISTGSGGIGKLQSFIVVTAVPVSLVLLPSLWDALRITLMLGKKA